MTESLTSSLPHPVEPVLAPECMNRLMQHPVSQVELGQQLTQIILNRPDTETLMSGLTNAIAAAFEAEYCLIATMTPEQAKHQAAVWYSSHAETGVPPGLYQKLGQLLGAATLASSDLWAIADTQAIEAEPLSLSSWDEMPIKAFLALKTQYQGQVNGVILIVRSQVHEWTASEKERIKAVSDLIAMAISQVQLQRQVRISTDYQTLLNQLTMAIRKSTELEQILQLALDGTAKALQVDRGLILLLKYADPLFKNRPQRRLPKAKATVVLEWSARDWEQRGSKSEKFLNQSFWLSECLLCQQAFLNAPRPLIVADEDDMPTENSQAIAAIFDREAMPSFLLMPLESQDTVLGFLLLQQRQPRFWVSQELELLELVSAQMSTAILQSQTQRQILALVEDRTAQLQSSLSVQAKLYEKTRQQIEQLRQLNQIMYEFIATVSHELTTPLTKMSLAIELLRQPELPPELRNKYLDILKQQCTHEINLINDLLAIQKLESHKSPLHLQKVDLKQVIQNLTQPFEERWAEKGLSLAVDLPQRSLMLQTDPESLDRILQELLTNAGKYSEPETTVNLTASYETDQPIPEIVLKLCNTGAGISPTEQTYIFDKFRRGLGVTQQAIQGTGLGLALVKSLVEHLNGKIAVSSNPTSQSKSWETCFTLTLPQLANGLRVV